MKTKPKFIRRLISNFVIRTAWVSPFAGLLVLPGNSVVANLALFAAIILGIYAAIVFGVTTLIAAEHAVKTETEVIEYFQWKPNIIAIWISSVMYVGLAVGVAAIGHIMFGIVVFFAAVAGLMWLTYVGKIDKAQKDLLLSTLAGNKA